MSEDVSQSPAKPAKVTILNQYFSPDTGATAELLYVLAVEFAHQGLDVKVITSHPSYGPPDTWVDCPSREDMEGVDVHRVWTTRFSKNNLLGRLVNIFTFMCQMFFRMLFSQSDRVYLYVTNPPFLIFIGGIISIFRRHKNVILLHDAYPQVAICIGAMKKGGLIEKIWQRLNKLAYRRADSTIVLCRKARDLIHTSYGIDESRIHVVPNWADGDTLLPLPKNKSEYAKTHGVIKPFTVMYAGNMGLYYDFDTILGAAKHLKDEPFLLLMMGGGGKLKDIEREVKEQNLENVMLLPYYTGDDRRDALAACDMQLVSIAPGIEGISYPSKLYSVLAMGTPVLGLSESDSELRSTIEENDVGCWAEVGDVDSTVQMIRSMMNDSEKLAQQGRNARSLFERDYRLEKSAREYVRVFNAI